MSRPYHPYPSTCNLHTYVAARSHLLIIVRRLSHKWATLAFLYISHVRRLRPEEQRHARGFDPVALSQTQY